MANMGNSGRISNINVTGQSMIALGPDILELSWRRWISARTTGPAYSYSACGYRDSNRLKFDAWVFEQGGYIQRKNKKYYILFDDTEDAAFFKLKYI